MAYFRAPLSGDVLQNINPWNWSLKAIGSQFGLININLGKSADPELEQEVLDQVGSYGRQLGRVSDALAVLVKHLDRERLDDDEKQALVAFERQFDDIQRLKARRRPRR